MIFNKVLEAVKLIRVKRSDSDHVDRLNHRWTSVLLVVVCLLLTTANYGSLPMFCWCPAYFVSAYENYAQKICWVSETYNIVEDRAQPPPFPANSRRGDASVTTENRFYDYSSQPQQTLSTNRKKVLRVSYYQWIPLLLLLQSFLFYLPGLIWKTLAARSGLDLANIVEASDTVQNAIYPERREKTLRYMSRHINRFLTYQNNYKGGCCRCIRGFLSIRLCFCCGNRFGNYLTTLYIGLKTVNLINIVLQILFIDFYLGSYFHLLGVAFFHGISTNQTVDGATAISSNHPAIAHILANPEGGSTGFASPVLYHMVKRTADQPIAEPLLANDSVFTKSEVINSPINRPIKIGRVDNSQRTKREEATKSSQWSQRQRKFKKRPDSFSFDWSTYMASLRSFPYLSSKLFPKITYCDFSVRQMTTFQLFTTQCVLSINFVNEKLFLMLWFWFATLFLINAYSLVIWSARLCSRSS